MNKIWYKRFAVLGFLAPNFFGFLLFVSLPVLASIAISFFQWDGLTWPPRFVGVNNYVELFCDEKFRRVWFNTLILMAGIPLNITVSLALALLLNRKLRGIVIYRTIFFLPTITAGVAIYLLWQWLYNPNYGPVNAFLEWCNIPAPAWLQSTFWAKPALIMMNLWIAAGGFNTVLFLAGLQNINPELYEAAAIDGANCFDRFRNVTLPQLRPTLFFIVTMGVINGFQSGFEQAYVMTRGGPDGSTTTVDFYIYDLAYREYRMGYASAAAWVLFAVVLVVTLIHWRHGKKEVE